MEDTQRWFSIPTQINRQLHLSEKGKIEKTKGVACATPTAPDQPLHPSKTPPIHSRIPIPSKIPQSLRDFPLIPNIEFHIETLVIYKPGSSIFFHITIFLSNTEVNV